MAEDTQKSIFDAFSGGQSATAVAPQETIPPPSVPSGEGGSIFSAFTPEETAPTTFPAPKITQQQPQEKQAPPSGSIFSAFIPSSQSELNKPETHPQLQSKSEPEDPNAPWYKKIWDTINAPLFDEQTAKNWFG